LGWPILRQQNNRRKEGSESGESIFGGKLLDDDILLFFGRVSPEKRWQLLLLFLEVICSVVQ
jgi:hypothetical protein